MGLAWDDIAACRAPECQRSEFERFGGKERSECRLPLLLVLLHNSTTKLDSTLVSGLALYSPVSLLEPGTFALEALPARQLTSPPPGSPLRQLPTHVASAPLPSKMPPTTIDSLPAELLAYIIELACSDPKDGLQFQRTRTRHARGRALALVAKKWTWDAQRLIWHGVSIYSSQEAESSSGAPREEGTQLAICPWRGARTDLGRLTRCWARALGWRVLF